MFASTSRLFSSTQCPDIETCQRNPCVFSHTPTPPSRPLSAPVPSTVPRRQTLIPPSSAKPGAANDSGPSGSGGSGAKRPPIGATGLSPPRKLIKVAGPAVPGTRPELQKSKTAPASRNKITTPATVEDRPPVLRVSAAQSKVPLSDRQQMVNRLYAQFMVLYEGISADRVRLAQEHSLAQEREIYDKASGMSYRNTTTNVLVAIKKRTPPKQAGDMNVGTEGEVQARVAASREWPSVELTAADLEPALLNQSQLEELGFLLEIPRDWGPGGERVSELDATTRCERCETDFQVRRDPSENECQYHWGRIWSRKDEGKKRKYYTCCRENHPHEGCTRGVHVFYEREYQQLHRRHPFTSTSMVYPSTSHLDIVAIDCEMVYTTAGMSVARVSVVDARGDVVFDELVRPTPGVDVLDYNTRFSGVSTLESATKDLDEVRNTLTNYIGPNTIIIGHAVDNDLKTLRMVHDRVVDTMQLFRQSDGRRRALRDLSFEFLGRKIQAGASSSGESSMGAIGHSSVEDAKATLDLVRWWIAERRKRGL